MAKQIGFKALKVYDLYNINSPTKPTVLKSSLFNQVAKIEKIKSDVELIGSGIDTNPEEFEHADPDLLSAFLSIKSEKKKSGKQISKSNITKQAQLLDKIFDYINMAKC